MTVLSLRWQTRAMRTLGVILLGTVWIGAAAYAQTEEAGPSLLGIESSTPAAPVTPPSMARDILSNAVAPVADIPGEYANAVRASVDQMDAGVDQMRTMTLPGLIGGLVQLAVGAIAYVWSPVNGTVHAIVGKPVTQEAESLGLQPEHARWLGVGADTAAQFMIGRAMTSWAAGSAGPQAVGQGTRATPVPEATTGASPAALSPSQLQALRTANPEYASEEFFTKLYRALEWHCGLWKGAAAKGQAEAMVALEQEIMLGHRPISSLPELADILRYYESYGISH